MKLSDISTITAGYPFRCAITPDEKELVRVIQMADAHLDTKIAWDNLDRTGLPGKKPSSWLKDGDIIFMSRGSSNIAICLEDVPEYCVCAPNFYVIKLKDDSIEPAFVAWQINQAIIQKRLDVIAAGAAQRSIPISEVKDLKLVILPQDEQKTIVKLQHSYVREKEIYLTLIKNRKEQMHSIAHQLLNKGGES